MVGLFPGSLGGFFNPIFRDLLVTLAVFRFASSSSISAGSVGDSNGGSLRRSVVFLATGFCSLICGSGDVRAFLGGEVKIFRPVGLARPSSIIASRGLILS